MQDLTTTQSLELFLNALQGRNVSKYTLRSYGDDIKQYLAYVKENRVDWDIPSRLGRLDIEQFLHFLDKKKLTGRSRARKLSSIRQFFKFLTVNEIIKNNIAESVIPPMKEEKDPIVLVQNEYKALLFEAQGNVRDYAILQLILQTGLRVSELVNLTLDDVDMENKALIVRQGKGKKDRQIPLNTKAIEALKSYLPIRDTTSSFNNVFLARNSTSLHTRTIWLMVKKYIKKAGIRKPAKVHTLRHTFGTYMINNGMGLKPLQELMGHKKIDTTMTYVHLVDKNLKQEIEDAML